MWYQIELSSVTLPFKQCDSPSYFDAHAGNYNILSGDIVIMAQVPPSTFTSELDGESQARSTEGSQGKCIITKKL